MLLSPVSIITLSTVFVLFEKVSCDERSEELARLKAIALEWRNQTRQSKFDSFQMIYPGTLWCGEGTRATSYEQLGYFTETDKCCREHDHCADSIISGGAKHGLYNYLFFTAQHCDCEDKFKQCLLRTCSVVAQKIGAMYFNLLGQQCFSYNPISSWYWQNVQDYYIDDVVGYFSNCFSDSFASMLRTNKQTMRDFVEVMNRYALDIGYDVVPDSWYL